MGRRSSQSGSTARLAIAVAGLTASWAMCPTEATTQARWRLSADPTIVIGSTDGARSETFHQIRGAITAPNGMIVVADGASRELRVFSSAGRFVRSFGRRGDGPREFRSIGWIDMCGGQAVVVYDSFRHRITKWDTEGSLLDEFTVEGPERDLPPYRVACGPSGTFAVLGWPEAVRTFLPVGPYRPHVVIGVADERGRRQRVIGEFPGAERLRTENNDRPHPFGKSTTVRMGVAGVYVGTADSFAIDLIAANGEHRTFGRGFGVTRVSRQMRERWVDAYVKRAAPPEQRPSLKRNLLDSEYSEWIPDVAPAYAGFQVDRLGFVWVSPYVVGDPGIDVWVEWSVFDPSGEFVATVRVPGHFQPTEIAEDYLLGVSTDAMGVERVHRYTLFR